MIITEVVSVKSTLLPGDGYKMSSKELHISHNTQFVGKPIIGTKLEYHTTELAGGKVPLYSLQAPDSTLIYIFFGWQPLYLHLLHRKCSR